MIEKINKIQKSVSELLKSYPQFRDDDKLLVANIWYKQLLDKNIDPEKISAKSFLEFYSNDILTNSDIITRARRKVQEENPELRGSTWVERHKEAEKFKF
jgi:hypothetical protein